MTTDERALSGVELNRAVAVAMGWVAYTNVRGGYTHVIWQRTGQKPPWEASQRPWHPEAYERIAAADISPQKHIEAPIPDFTTDLNALRDGPEALLRAAGLQLNVSVQDGEASAGWGRAHPLNVWVSNADTEALARARAALAGLQAMKEAANG